MPLVVDCRVVIERIDVATVGYFHGSTHRLHVFLGYRPPSISLGLPSANGERQAEPERRKGRVRDPSCLRRVVGCHARSSSGVLVVVTTTTGGTAVLEKVFYTSVLVSDQDKALDFYTIVLGLEKRVENPTPDGPRFLTVGVKGDSFQLALWPGTPRQAEPAMGRPRRRSRSRPTISGRRSRS